MKEARKKNENLVAFRIPKEMSVTLELLGINPKEACLRALYEIANKNSLYSNPNQENLFQAPFFQRQ